MDELKLKSASGKYWGLGFVLVAVAALGVLIWLHRSGGARPAAPARLEQATITASTNTSGVAAVSDSPSALDLSNREALFPSFRQHPFAVSHEDDHYAWTAEDGRSPAVVRQLAHNELEFERMAGENDRIYRRQLVYLKDTAAAEFERAKLTGEPVRQLTLPALDGHEVKFEIVKSQLNSSGRQGMLSGRVAGNPDSLVTFAFEDGREAFTVLSPKENLFIVGEPRESGEVIVKAINPDTYGVGPMAADDAVKPGSTKK